MIRTKIINIKKDIIKRKEYTKKEIKTIILKSIIQNRYNKPAIRVKAMRKTYKCSRLSYISKQNNVCVKTGRIKGVYNMFNFSRHFIKKTGCLGNLQNIKIVSW